VQGKIKKSKILPPTENSAPKNRAPTERGEKIIERIPRATSKENFQTKSRFEKNCTISFKAYSV